MNKNTLKAVVFIAAFLLLAAGLIALFTDISGSGEHDSPNTSNAPQTVVTPTPATSTPIPTPTPQTTIVITPTPKPTPTPTPTPISQPTPTPKPDFVDYNLGSGTFSSDTGVTINVHAQWSAKTMGRNKVEITVKAELESYTLQLNPSAKALIISINGQQTALDVPEVNIDTNTLTRTDLGTHKVVIDLAEGQSKDIPVNVQWQFGGIYSGVDLSVVEASGTIPLKR